VTLKSHVTGINDVFLNEVGRTTAVSLGGTHYEPGMRWDTVMGHLVKVPLGDDRLAVYICMTSWVGD
jgi:5-keto 4-deoxyuronate isomerase